ncbi:MAG: hypothetical protein HYX69_00445 [Planctomycetia bacterium]|nr:hypothetical protein [Planctomycetia bacterium]
MTQAQLEREVARATGESVSTIRHRGFSIVDMPAIKLLDDPASAQTVDWEAIDEARIALFPDRTRRRMAA